MSLGKIISVEGPIVDIVFKSEKDIPNLYEAVETECFGGNKLMLEVVEHLENKIVRCVALGSTLNLQYNAVANSRGDTIRIPVGEELFGRIVNAIGEPIDRKGKIEAKEYAPIRRSISNIRLNPDRILGGEAEILETGIKMVDFLFPLIKGSKTGILGGAALGKSILVLEMIHNVVEEHEGACVFTGAGERIREGNELYFEFVKQGIIDKVMMAFGQMDEPPGARFEVAMTGVTLAEYLQDQNKDVLFFMDNVYRFVQSGAEISTLLGRVPSETGYQPTLASEVSDFQERIRSREGGSITAIEAVYVPADDLTDPAVVTIFSYLDSILVLSRDKVQLGLYPAIDPLISSSSNLNTAVVGREHFNTAQECLKVLTKYEELRRVVMIIGIEELSKADRTLYDRAKKILNFLTQPFYVTEAYTGKKGEYVALKDTILGCQKIINGRADRMPEESLYLIGRFEEARY
ncbi:MAG: F0F1 ATP synthase subunit beta [Candidatus Omnitrophica bacterium]|nr:F0F1 ATP synthase subunit beta [Candidatus Omnitrophota bacterium]MCK5259603.1 F0F1 ATP synthase subunit beta [Candidatus Omnitrophota bacterium]